MCQCSISGHDPTLKRRTTRLLGRTAGRLRPATALLATVLLLASIILAWSELFRVRVTMSGDAKSVFERYTDDFIANWQHTLLCMVRVCGVTVMCHADSQCYNMTHEIIPQGFISKHTAYLQHLSTFNVHSSQSSKRQQFAPRPPVRFLAQDDARQQQDRCQECRCCSQPQPASRASQEPRGPPLQGGFVSTRVEGAAWAALRSSALCSARKRLAECS